MSRKENKGFSIGQILFQKGKKVTFFNGKVSVEKKEYFSNRNQVLNKVEKRNGKQESF